LQSSNFSVHIQPGGYTIMVQPGETILAAALRQGYHFPHNCRNAVCGTCKGLLVEGQVTYGESMILALSDEERENGYALFCLAKPLTNCVIHIDGVIGPAQLPIRKLTCEVIQCKELSGNVHQVFLKQPDDQPLQYRAGQYLEILHKDMSPRPFSIANAPLDANYIELHIKHTEDNPFTLQVLADIREKNELRIAGPYGNCIYHREPQYPIILLAGGTGFAPFKAILEEALAEGLKRPIYLYWGTRTVADLYMHDLISRWAQNVPLFKYIPALSNKLPDPHWTGKTGLIHEIVLAEHPDLSSYHVYASGPPEMVFAAQRAFLACGLNQAFLYSDLFDYQTKELE
jgi:CDP-4-dehydro-6-deoxyglucose reductase